MCSKSEEWPVGLRAWLVGQLAPSGGTVAEPVVREASLFADEDRGWHALTTGPRDVPYWTLVEQLADAAEAYRQNPLAFRIVELTTDYALGRGLRLRAAD